MESPQQPLPRYPSIVFTVLKVIVSRILRRKRSLLADALRLTAKITPPVKYEGLENIPADGGYVLMVNHYARPGFDTQWLALAMSAAIPQEVAWVMSQAWAFEGNPLGIILRPIMRSLLANINWVYGFLSMPSMVAGFNDAQSRAAGVRRTVEFAQANPNAVIGLAPEGQDSPMEGVGLAPAGGGKFMLHLNRMGFALLPVGIAERAGQLVVRFGQKFDIQTETGMPAGKVDDLVREVVRDKVLEQIK